MPLRDLAPGFISLSPAVTADHYGTLRIITVQVSTRVEWTPIGGLQKLTNSNFLLRQSMLTSSK